MRTYTIAWENHRLELGRRTCVMGIINVTPDSFSDGGRYTQLDAAIAHAEKLIEDGADILDIGGESTRPFSKPLSAEEELRRVIPVLNTLAGRVSIPISIDTWKSKVAEEALNSGASMINDIGGLCRDSNMVSVAAAHDVPVIAMHMKGTPQTMQRNPVYGDLITEIRSFLKHTIDVAQTHGIRKSCIIIDPGIGFGKTVSHNLSILRNLSEFEVLDAPILVGPSRKSFIRHILEAETGISLAPDAPRVETGTQAVIAAAVLNGAHIIRVHDAGTARTIVNIVDKIKKPD